MTIEQKKCDTCGKVHELIQKTIELREVSGITVPQIDRRDGAETASWYMLGGSKVYTLSIYDFCDLACAKGWIDQKLVEKLPD